MAKIVRRERATGNRPKRPRRKSATAFFAEGGRKDSKEKKQAQHRRKATRARFFFQHPWRSRKCFRQVLLRKAPPSSGGVSMSPIENSARARQKRTSSGQPFSACPCQELNPRGCRGAAPARRDGGQCFHTEIEWRCLNVPHRKRCSRKPKTNVFGSTFRRAPCQELNPRGCGGAAPARRWPMFSYGNVVISFSCQSKRDLKYLIMSFAIW